jgi:DNA-binding MarR family transcriptional regulator
LTYKELHVKLLIAMNNIILTTKIHQLTNSMMQKLELAFAKESVGTFQQCKVLYGISCFEASTNQVQLAKFLNLTEGSISRHIFNLEKDELITRVLNPKNRRKYDVNLTEKGVTIFTKAKTIYNRVIKTFFVDLTASQKTELEILLDIVSKTITK